MIRKYTQQGKNHVNQDICDHQDYVVWMIDGATPLFGDDLLGGNDVQRTMQQISQQLKIQSKKYDTLSQILFHACKAVEQEYQNTISNYEQIEKYKLPTFACTMIKIHEETIDWYAIGDCEIYLDGKVYTDDRFARVNQRNQQPTDDKLTLLQSSRKLLNNDKSEEGYWIGSLDGKGIIHGKGGILPYDGTSPIYLYSDGMSKVFADKQLLKEKIQVESEAFIEYIHANRHRTTDDITMIEYTGEKDD